MLFPPLDAPKDVDVAVAELTETVHQAPTNFGLVRSRWWLDGIRQAVPWLRDLTVSGVWQVLDRFDLVYKRGRRYVHSPDPAYLMKEARIKWAWQQVEADPVHNVLLYQDELTYYRCPTVMPDYAIRHFDAPRANQGHGYNTSRRIAGCLDAYDGRLIAWQRSTFDHKNFLKYLQYVETCYPQAKHLYIAVDNWPVHYQKDVLAALETSKITLLFLPTYAPWLNPIEKVWKKLKQEILHLHRQHDQWKVLQERIEQWLIQHETPSPALLQYVGLSPD